MRSAIEFPTSTRIHIGLGVRDVQRSLRFYETLLGMGPSKTRPGYAKFECVEPAVNLSLNQLDRAVASQNPGTHYGIQVKSTEAVAAAAERLSGAGLQIHREENVTCCYAAQDKVWVTDPDGNSWEIFVVTQADTPAYMSSREGDSGCCATPKEAEEACC